MLRTSYDKLENIPENQRGAYIERDGRWLLDELDKDHSLVQKRDELLRSESALKSQNTKLANDKAALESRTIPEGQRAVPVEVAELGEAAQTTGWKKDEFATVKTERDELQSKLAARDRAEIVGRAAKAANRSEQAFADHADAKNLQFAEADETVDGKAVKQIYVVGRDAAGAETKTRVEDYVPQNAAHVPLAVVQKKGMNFPAQTSGGGGDQTHESPARRVVNGRYGKTVQALTKSG